jgi:hypothetical protein
MLTLNEGTQHHRLPASPRRACGRGDPVKGRARRARRGEQNRRRNRRRLGSTPCGHSTVHAGAPKPDIRTVDALKQTLLRAKSVSFTSSTVGIYLATTLFPRLGIADEMASKSTTSGVAAVATETRRSRSTR